MSEFSRGVHFSMSCVLKKKASNVAGWALCEKLSCQAMSFVVSMVLARLQRLAGLDAIGCGISVVPSTLVVASGATVAKSIGFGHLTEVLAAQG